jgi:hypothetical protein
MSKIMIEISIQASIEDADDFGRRMKAFAEDLEGAGVEVVRFISAEVIDRQTRDRDLASRAGALFTSTDVGQSNT